MKRGVVYFLSDGEAIKIGMTERLKRRIYQLERETGCKLNLLAAFPTPPASEYELHQKFAHLRMEGEWFKHDQEILDYVKEASEPPRRTRKPYAQIRRTLAEGIRNSDKPATVKHHAEVLIGTIDHIHRHGEDDDSRRAFQANYARLMQVASGQ